MEISALSGLARACANPPAVGIPRPPSTVEDGLSARDLSAGGNFPQA